MHRKHSLDHIYRAPVVESITVVLTFKFMISDYIWIVGKTVIITVYTP